MAELFVAFKLDIHDVSFRMFFAVVNATTSVIEENAIVEWRNTGAFAALGAISVRCAISLHTVHGSFT
jgi:hypothetical protein